MRFSFFLPVLALLPGSIGAALQTRDTKPTFLIVPGAWHQPLHYKTLIATLIGNGYETTIVDLPNSTRGPPYLPYQSDVDAVSKLLNFQVNAGKEVIMVMHSYGGVCGSAAIQGLTKTARKAAGKKGGVIGLVYIAAFAFDTGIGFQDFDLSGLTWLNIHVSHPILPKSIGAMLTYSHVGLRGVRFCHQSWQCLLSRCRRAIKICIRGPCQE